MKAAFVYVSRLLGLFHLSRWLLRKRLLILCYHGFELSDEADFRPALFIRPETFRRRMKMLAERGFTVLPLDEAMKRLRGGDLPPNAVVITIDDGFYSVKQAAQPILAEYGFPSTLYATTNRIMLGTPVFRMVIQYLFWKTRATAIEFANHSWVAAGRYDLTDAEVATGICRELVAAGEYNGDEERREAICREVAAKLRVDYDEIVRSGMFTHVLPDDLKELDRSGMDVQLHTHTHTLTHNGEPMIEREISVNAQLLNRWLDKRCTHFCYPLGEWQPSYLNELAKLGVESATTCEAGRNDRSTNPLALYRSLDGENITDLQFEDGLYGFSEMFRVLVGRRRKRNGVRSRAEPAAPYETAGAARD
ncbi:MAG: polysaccharide deacetylase family protein [Halofilum sp. (in: g-proteobacteria)]